MTCTKMPWRELKGRVIKVEHLLNVFFPWIICANRPLRPSVLRYALGVKIGKPKLDQENLPDIGSVVSICAGLITIDVESGIICLVHYTTVEYFKKAPEEWFPDAQADITEACITCLSFDSFAPDLKC